MLIARGENTKGTLVHRQLGSPRNIISVAIKVSGIKALQDGQVLTRAVTGGKVFKFSIARIHASIFIISSYREVS